MAMLAQTDGAMKTVASNHPANSEESVVPHHPTFSLVNALVYVLNNHLLPGVLGEAQWARKMKKVQAKKLLCFVTSKNWCWLACNFLG